MLSVEVIIMQLLNQGYIVFYVYSCLQMRMLVSQNHSLPEKLPNATYLPLVKTSLARTTHYTVCWYHISNTACSELQTSVGATSGSKGVNLRR